MPLALALYPIVLQGTSSFQLGLTGARVTPRHSYQLLWRADYSSRKRLNFLFTADVVKALPC